MLCKYFDNHSFSKLPLAVVLIISLSPFTMRSEYFRHITMEEGLSQNTVLAISQDKLGRMWFGTKEGVNVYDGTGIQVFKGNVPDGPDGKKLWIGNEVSSIQSDSAGDIYMLIDENLVKYSIDSGRFCKFTTHGNVRSLCGYNGEIAYIQGDSVMLVNKNAKGATMKMKLPKVKSGTRLSIDSSNFYISTSNGLHIYNRIDGSHKHLLPDKKVYNRYVSRDGTLWISTFSNGLYRYREGDAAPESVSKPVAMNGALNADQSRNIVEDREGKIWYGSFSGLYRYDPASGETNRIMVPHNLGGLTHSSVYGLYCDRRGNIWVGTYYGGVNYFSPASNKFLNFNYAGFVPEAMSRSLIKDIVTDREGFVWFATDGAGVGCLDKNWIVKDHISSLSKGRKLLQNNVRCLEYDSVRDKLYIGTHLGGLSVYDIKRKELRNLIDEPKYIKFPGEIIHHLKIHKDNLFITSTSGLSYLNLSSGKIRHLPVAGSPYEFDIDPKGDVYYSTSYGRGLYKICNPLSVNPKIVQIVSRNQQTGTTDICAVEKGVYVTTKGHGLLYYPDGATPAETIDSSSNQLPDDYCYAVTKGKGDLIYVATGKYIVQINPGNGSVRNLAFSGIFRESHIVNGTVLYGLDNGDMLVGSSQGISYLRPGDFLSDGTEQSDSKIYFSRLMVQNRDISPANSTGKLEKTLPYANCITLSPDDNEFCITVGLSDYNATAGMPAIEYRLDGYDKDWQSASENVIKYRALSPGNYTLHARQPGGKDISIDINVASPWYLKWWAWTVYIILILLTAGILIYKSITAAKLRLALNREKAEKELIERVNHEKLVFFTDISHEFQTPLTLINSHIDNLLVQSQQNSMLTKKLLSVRNQSSQLSHLVTQLLEFRKLQQNKQVLHIGVHDANEALKEAALPFESHAVKRNILFKINTGENAIYGAFDPALINRVLVNLLSNAFKYTPDGGEISCTVKGNDAVVVFEVADNGKGISQDSLPYIFDRFYSGNSDESDKNSIDFHSTGIGLAFAKSIVVRHHGVIEVDSEEGKGSLFRVKIPQSVNAFANDGNVEFKEVVWHDGEYGDPLEDKGEDVSDPQEDAAKRDESPLLLIVEDNRELAESLKEYFSAKFRVAIAFDGESGLEMARELSPDIIISDVMMPGMRGTELCAVVKSDIALCHIPVILLTALHSPESKLEGMEVNADDYVTKPFDSNLLLARVENLLRMRSILRKQFEKQPFPNVDLSDVEPMDRDLLTRTTEIIERNISNLEFDIPMLCREVAMSRSLFFNKFKSLTGMTPNVFIQTYRLNYAAALLKAQPHLTIAEVADKSGFESTVYFSRCFKKQFGVPPLAYRKGSD